MIWARTHFIGLLRWCKCVALFHESVFVYSQCHFAQTFLFPLEFFVPIPQATIRLAQSHWICHCNDNLCWSDVLHIILWCCWCLLIGWIMLANTNHRSRYCTRRGRSKCAEEKMESKSHGNENYLQQFHRWLLARKTVEYRVSFSFRVSNIGFTIWIFHI